MGGIIESEELDVGYLQETWGVYLLNKWCMPAEVNQDKLVLQRLLIPGKASDTEGQLDKASATNVEPRGEVLQQQGEVKLVL